MVKSRVSRKACSPIQSYSKAHSSWFSILANKEYYFEKNPANSEEFEDWWVIFSKKSKSIYFGYPKKYSVFMFQLS